MSTSRIRNINPAALGPAVGFSHVTIASGLVWLGGQIGCNTDGVVESPGNIAAQFDRAIRNVGTALREVGTAPENAVIARV
jgi:enamine deaminase RidA (YjgF/YER057c/UK114 family)